MRVRKCKGILGLWPASEKGGREEKFRTQKGRKPKDPWTLLGTVLGPFPGVGFGAGCGAWEGLSEEKPHSLS